MKRENQSARVVVRVSESLHGKIAALAESNGELFSDVVRAALEAFLKEQESVVKE